MTELTTDIKQLPSISEYGNVESNMIQVNCQRDVSGTNFVQGSQEFLFNVSGNQRWSPSESYFKMRIKLTDNLGVQPTLVKKLAYAENLVANLYSNIYCYIGNTDVSSIVSFAGQAGMLRYRLGKTKSWLDGVGLAAHNLEPSLATRIENVSSDTTADEDGLAQPHEIEVLFQPPVGLFNTDAVLPSGAYRISLTPHSSLTGAVQSSATGTLGAGNQALVEIENVQFFMNVYRAEQSADTVEYYLPLEEINIQQKSIDTSAGQNNLNFTMPVSTIGIATWIQPSTVGANFLAPPSYFGVATTADPANGIKQTNDLKHLQLTFGNTSKPQTDFDSSYTTTQQRIMARYTDTQINSGLYGISAESFGDWQRRGPLYYYNFIRSEDDRSTELQLSSQYGSLDTTTNQHVAAIYRTNIKVSVESGFVTSVRKLAL